MAEEFFIAPLQPTARDMAKAITLRCWPNNPKVADRIDEELRMGSWCCAQRTFGSRIVGVAGWMRSPCCHTIGEFLWCNVEPEFQGRGIGRMLGNARLDEMLKAGCRQSMISTHLREHYERSGYRVIAEVKGVADTPSYLMIMDL